VVSLCYFIFFFFFSYFFYLDLHSFPTRRSSDLPFWVKPGVGSTPSSGIPDSRDRRAAPDRRRITRMSITATSHTPPDLRALRTRSEEHTSELQSRENLVCRLLLEKKNQILIVKN